MLCCLNYSKWQDQRSFQTLNNVHAMASIRAAVTHPSVCSFRTHPQRGLFWKPITCDFSTLALDILILSTNVMIFYSQEIDFRYLGKLNRKSFFTITSCTFRQIQIQCIISTNINCCILTLNIFGVDKEYVCQCFHSRI